MPGFEAANEELDSLHIPKLIDISHPSEPAIPVAITEPQDPAEIRRRIDDATFTSGADRVRAHAAAVSLSCLHRMGW